MGAQHPTEERSAYLVLSLDVSRVATDAGPELLRRTFLDAVRGRIAAFLLRYREGIPPLGDVDARLDHFQGAEGLIGTVLDVVSTTPYEVHLLIDEHDHFANRPLAGGSADLHEAAASCAPSTPPSSPGRAPARWRGCSSPAFARLMLEDLSSGFNIATHGSLAPVIAFAPAGRCTIFDLKASLYSGTFEPVPVRCHAAAGSCQSRSIRVTTILTQGGRRPCPLEFTCCSASR